MAHKNIRKRRIPYEIYMERFIPGISLKIRSCTRKKRKLGLVKKEVQTEVISWPGGFTPEDIESCRINWS